MNVQPIEKESREVGLEVHSIWKSIQGEGPLVGMPAAFVRLAGCNLQCPLCDTDYTARTLMSAEEVLRSVKSFGNLDLVVLTGGEPLRQDIGRLVRLCFEEGYSVQIETNGTMYRSDLPFGSLGLSVVCSPKTGKIDSRLVPFIGAYKYVVRYGEVDENDGLPVSVLGRKERVARPTYNNVSQVFVQPADEGHEDRNRLNTQVAVDVCLKFGYRLGLQIHKIVGLA